ncbi:transcriptional regulator, TetR family [Cohnella sp. OV330]|uniref:TetR/AcrR family transcriptional regulator n=1 Tax=Cohnella sp. OV330 TaxID=1855288 RepID=UPI0008F19B77|nr:TetR/AcrR family transcriptional regulator [Cohnella sp. OV330]SFB51625.1 transcriptional regulator, TetR family [Cohnella sp. OV330]
MKQEERRLQTIQRLMEATKALIAEKGCHAITMQDIMSRSGMSKGAIFHYVKSKNEIFAWVLQERLEETNASFMNEVEKGRRTFDEPMQRIKESIVAYENPRDITNKVLLYLLGKEDDPAVAAALRQYYERSVLLSKTWIETGQRYGVIHAAVDAGKTGDLFTLMTLGLRIRSGIPQAQAVYKAEDLTTFIRDILTKG